MRAVAASLSALAGPAAPGSVRATPRLAAPPSAASAAEFRAVAALAAALHVPLPEVREVYRQQLQRLTAGARIHSFLGVLAMRNTRALLRGGRRLTMKEDQS